MTRKLTTGFLFVLAIFAFSFNNASAERAVSSSPSSTLVQIIDVPYESVNQTGGISYLLKRIGEKISMFFAFSDERKIHNYKKLVNVRLSELKYVIENKEMGYFEKSTQRYFTTVGELTNLLIASNMKSEFISVKDELSSHIPVLIKLRDSYDPGTAEWRFVEDDINYVKGYINNLSSE